MTTTLVLSGIARAATDHARTLLPAGAVTVLAPDPLEETPSGWIVSGSADFTHAFLRSRAPIFIPSLDGWLDRLVDDAAAWDDRAAALSAVTDPIEELATLWADAPWDAVAATSNPGLCAAPDDERGRLRHEIAGIAAAKLGAVSSRVHLLVAGRVLDLSSAPRI